tara:strand:+ start:252 stop:503 length:252 start_codon:yes stop_codon:yes gene_type:complete
MRNFDKNLSWGWVDKNTISICWTVDDVKQAFKNIDKEITLTDDDCRDVLERVLNDHDANYGVTWDNLIWSAEDLFPKKIIRKD